MTEDEFRPIIKKLKVAYRRDNFFSDNDMIDLWYERLGDLDGEKLMEAVDNYIDANAYQPTIADIRAEYEKIEEAHRAIMRELDEIYGRTRGIYPDMFLCADEETRTAAQRDAAAAWWALIRDYPEDEWIYRARKIESMTNDYIYGAETSAASKGTPYNPPPLADFFRGLNN